MKKVFLTLSIAIFLAWPNLGQAVELKSTFPRLVNYFLKWEISDEEVDKLAKWDMLILDMEVQENSLKQVQKIKELNPDIVLIAYITSESIYKGVDAYGNAFLRQKLNKQVADSWWFRAPNGTHVSSWPGTQMFNVSDEAGKNISGKRFNEYLPEFVNSELKSTGLWDGVFYDNTWSDIHWMNNGDIDLNNDGEKDSREVADKLWYEGYRKMLDTTRTLTGDDFIILGNGRTNNGYQDVMNGMMLEGFPPTWERDGTWTGAMNSYLELPLLNHPPSVPIINSFNKSQTDYKIFRYGLSSALMGEGYYSFDYDVTNHGQTWWYDEYDVNLGPAESKAYNVLNKKSTKLEPGLWRRDFKYASVFVNTMDKDRGFIFSKEEMEKIKGVQDPEFNNGERLSYLRLSPNDGVILLKKTSAITNNAFTNGYFFRIFDINGEQVRNGFFSYLNNFAGGDELIIASGSKDEHQTVSLVGREGKIDLHKNGNGIAQLDPYNGLFKGDLSMAAEIEDGYVHRVAIGPGVGGGPQVLIFTCDGVLRGNFFAYDKDLRGGVNVAIGDVDADGEPEIVTGPGRGESPVVKIFSMRGELKHEFLAYHKDFKGGVDVAVADVDNDGLDDIITGPGKSGGPHIRVFNGEGKEKASFFAYDKSFRGGVKVSASDLNDDGVMEILVGIKNFY